MTTLGAMNLKVEGKYRLKFPNSSTDQLFVVVSRERYGCVLSRVKDSGHKYFLGWSTKVEHIIQ